MPEAGAPILGPVLALFTLAAQPRAGRSSSTDVLLWVGVLIVVTLAGAIVILAIRRRTLAAPRTPDAGSVMEELRGMRDRGQMTQTEFDAAIAAMKARLRAQVQAGTPSASPSASTQAINSPPRLTPDNPRLPPSG